MTALSMTAPRPGIPRRLVTALLLALASAFCFLLPGTAVASPATARAGPVTSELLLSSDTLESGHPADVVVVLNNTGEADLRLADVAFIASEGMSLCSVSAAEPSPGISRCPGAPTDDARATSSTLRAGSQTVFSYRLFTTGRIWPGSKLFVLSFTFLQPLAPLLPPATAVVSRKVEYSVLGESEFIGAVGVPSFLLLPGFLTLATYRLLARRGRRASDPPALDVTAVEFVALSATLSIVAIPVFWLATWLIARPRTYLSGYDTGDLLAVWIGATVIGAAAFTLPAAVRASAERRRTPTNRDDPLTIIRKLARQGLPLTLPQAQFTSPVPGGGGTAQAAYIFSRPEPDQDSFWLLPAIEYRFLSPVDEELKRRVLRGLAPDGDPGDLARLLRRHRRRIPLRWAAPHEGPLRIPADRVTAATSAAPLLHMTV